MKSLILTAGLGTRLRPLTLERAKPTIPLLGKPLLFWLLENLLSQGVDGFRLNLHYLPHSVEQIFERVPGLNMPVSFAHEPEILGTAGPLKANEAFFDNDTFLMVNGDIVIDFSFREALAFHKNQGALATLLMFPQPSPPRYFPIRIDAEGNLLNFPHISRTGDALPHNYVFTGIHILEPEIFQFIPHGVPYEINEQVYPEAIKRGAKVLGFPVSGYWNDVGSPQRYLEAQRDLLNFETKLCVSGTKIPYTCVSPEARIEESAAFGPFSTAGEGCLVRSESIVENSILWEDVEVMEKAHVQNCIAGSGVILKNHVHNKIVTRFGELDISD